MGFKNNYPLDPALTNGSLTGTQTLALPFNAQTNITNAEELINDINTVAGSSVVSTVSRLVKSTDALETYTGFSGDNFAITPGEGYLVTVSGAVNYIIVGSHNPTLGLDLDPLGINSSASGTSLFAYPYHSTAGNAEDLINEINAHAGASVVSSISRFVRTTDSLESYTGFSGVNFGLSPGEAYFITVSGAGAGAWVPDHF
jgi:alpha-glucuronidase